MKKIVCAVLAIVLLLASVAFANSVDEEKNAAQVHEIARQALTKIAGEEQIEELRSIYERCISDKQGADDAFRQAIAGVHMQAEAYHFTDEQVRAMLAGLIDTTEAAYNENAMGSAEPAAKYTPSISPIGYNIYINGELMNLTSALNIDGNTYVQLRDFCQQSKMEVIWTDPKVQQMPVPYGRYHGGVTILNPSILSVEKMKHSFTQQEGEYINISGIVERYADTNANLPYAFSYVGGERSLLIRKDGKEASIALDTFPSYEQVYISVDDFKRDISPYWVDMCIENERILEAVK